MSLVTRDNLLYFTMTCIYTDEFSLKMTVNIVFHVYINIYVWYCHTLIFNENVDS